MRRRRGTIACVPVLLMGGLLATPVFAAGPPGSGGKVDEFYGTYGDSVAIAVPPFHGLEPQLAVTYSSARGNGFLGVGWALDGVSVIERASPGKGAPRYDATDIFLLDGEELVACVPASVSPSCTTGGTHATRIESYLRVQFVSASNTWYVWQKDGRKATFAAVYVTALGTFRWGQRYVTDTSNNTVTYNWWCDPAKDCYLDTITYNGNTVQLIREARPDHIYFANGVYIGETAYRLQWIDVRVGSSRARAYSVQYTTSAAPARSLLSRVQQGGTDARLDGSWPPLPSSLPPTTTSWGDAATGHAFTNTGVSFGGWNFGSPPATATPSSRATSTATARPTSTCSAPPSTT